MMIKHIDIKEFRLSGYLQEVNRRFFRPLGLALEVRIGDDGTEAISGIWDNRDDPEGIFYDISNSPDERKTAFKTKKAFVDEQMKAIGERRTRLLGFVVEPVE